jgi:hypothetical protein
MYEDLFLKKMFERILEHYRENQTLSRSQLIQIIKEENHRVLVSDQIEIYGELELEAKDAAPAT